MHHLIVAWNKNAAAAIYSISMHLAVDSSGSPPPHGVKATLVTISVSTNEHAPLVTLPQYEHSAFWWLTTGSSCPRGGIPKINIKNINSFH
jgi:hypothetical protein